MGGEADLSLRGRIDEMERRFKCVVRAEGPSRYEPSPPVGCRPIGGLGYSPPPTSAGRRSAPIPRPQARVICADFQPATLFLFRDPARSRTYRPQTDWAGYRRGPSARTAGPSARTVERANQTALYGRQTEVCCKALFHPTMLWQKASQEAINVTIAVTGS